MLNPTLKDDYIIFSCKNAVEIYVKPLLLYYTK